MKPNSRIAAALRHGLLSLAACIAVTSPALAAAPAAPAASAPLAALAEACREDVQKLCPGIQPGEGRIAACLREKRKEVSEGCKSALKAERGHRKAHP